MKIKVVLSNRYATFLDPYPKKQLRFEFGYLSPSAFWSPLYKKRDADGNRLWDGIQSFLKYDRVPTGLFLGLKDKIEEQWDVHFKIYDERRRPKFEDIEDSDRPFQNECFRTMCRNSNCGGIIINATGTGKTRIAGMYFKALRGFGVFIVDELGLLAQAQEEIAKFIDEPVGYIGNMKFKPNRITVATAQTLHKHRNDPKFRPWLKQLKTIIIDEIHEMLGKRNHEIVSSIKPHACFGLTATLQLNKKPVKMKAMALTGPVIYKFPYSEGVKQKYLTPGIAISVLIERRGYKHLDYWEDYDRVIAKSSRFNNVIEKIIRAAVKRKKYLMTLVQRPKHVRIISRRVDDIDHRVAYGAVKVRDRKQAKVDFDSKRLRLLIANQVFKKGTNLKVVDMMINAANRPSANDAQQIYGRGVRLCDNKRGLIYFDIGFVNPEGVSKKSSMHNRFAKGSRIRRRALKKNGVPVFTFNWNGSVKELMKFAERKLDKVLAKMERD